MQQTELFQTPTQIPTDFRIDTISKIMDCGLTATEKVVATQLYLKEVWTKEPEQIPDSVDLKSDVVILTGISGRRLAERYGVHEGTANSAIKKLADYGILKREVEHIACDQDGNPIPSTAMRTPRPGDHWESSTTLTVPMIPRMDRLPAKPELTPKQKRDRETAKTNHELRTLGRLLKSFKCPECGQTGEWHLTCGACGATWTADEMVGNDDTPKIPEKAVTDGTCVTAFPPENALSPETGKTAPSSAEGRENRVTGRGTEEEGVLMDASLSVSPQDDQAEPLAGADTVDYLADLGAAFCFVAPKDKRPINPRDDQGDELSWPDAPISAEAARRHLARGGNVGLLTGRGQMVLIDIDDHLPELLQRYPTLQVLPRITRQNAPDRGKLLCFVPESDMPASHKYAGNGHTIEILGTGHQGVIAGVHQSGATIEFTPGELVQFSHDQLTAMCTEWTAQDQRGDFRTPAAMAAVSVKGDLLRTALHWKATDEAYLAEVYRLIAQCPRKGQYIAIRADDRTPSTRECRDSYSQTVKPVWRDYGSGQTLDAVELYCCLTGTDKRTYQWEIVNEYRAAHGQPGLHLRQS